MLSLFYITLLLFSSFVVAETDSSECPLQLTENKTDLCFNFTLTNLNITNDFGMTLTVFGCFNFN